jgi:putative ABC transport system permease protein
VLAVAVKMLLYNRSRFVLTNAGIAVAFFLSAAQFGMMVGWCNTASAVVRHAGVDLWVMAPHTPAFDYGTPIPRHRLQQVRNVPGVAWAEGMVLAWNTWQRPDGRRVNVEMVGLDESSVGGPWEMKRGTVDVIHRPDTVIVDELYLEAPGGEVAVFTDTPTERRDLEVIQVFIEPQGRFRAPVGLRVDVKVRLQS